MTKEELIFLIKNLGSEDKNGNIEGIFIGRHGERIITDSIRVDMDSGRIIIAQSGTDYYNINKSNWETELTFAQQEKKHEPQ
jgi:hypothetical protein